MLLPGWLRVRTIIFYRFRTVFRVQNGIATLHGSCVRLTSPSDLACVRACVRARDRYVAAWVVIVVYSYMFRHESVIIRNNRNFFQTTNTESVQRIIIIIHSTSLDLGWVIISDCGGIEAPRYCELYNSWLYAKYCLRVVCRKSHLLFRVLCACEPYVLSIPNGTSRT